MYGRRRQQEQRLTHTRRRLHLHTATGTHTDIGRTSRNTCSHCINAHKKASYTSDAFTDGTRNVHISLQAHKDTSMTAKAITSKQVGTAWTCARTSQRHIDRISLPANVMHSRKRAEQRTGARNHRNTHEPGGTRQAIERGPQARRGANTQANQQVIFIQQAHTSTLGSTQSNGNFMKRDGASDGSPEHSSTHGLPRTRMRRHTRGHISKGTFIDNLELV